jgi:hypothetical protein
MSSQDRKPYLTATSLDQALLDACADNLLSQLEMVCEIEGPAGTIYASDRNKYAGDTFYEALLVFPPTTRTLGEWLSPTLEFSTLKLELNNADGRFNDLVPGGVNFAGWIDRRVEVKLGVGENASTYKTVFRGKVTDEGGFGRTTKSIVIVARDDFESMRVKFPTTVWSQADCADIDDSVAGTPKPIIYGDWTQAPFSETNAAVPAYALNRKDAALTAGTVNVKLGISENDLSYFDPNNVYLVRNQETHQFDPADIVNIGAGNKIFEIRNSGTSGVTVIVNDSGSTPYTYQTGDKIYVRVKGKDLGSHDDNIVEMARDILITYGGVSSGDFDANWDTYRDKNDVSYPESRIATFKARCHIAEQKPAIEYAFSLLEQVRLECGISRDLKLKLRSLHWEDFPATPGFTLTNFDLEKGSFKPRMDARNNYNRLQGFYNYLPDKKDNYGKTNPFRNQDAIDQAQGRTIEKGVVFPNLYEKATVDLQVQAILKMSSAAFEVIDATLTWRALLLDIGDFVGVDVKIGGSQFDRVPALIRQIGYDTNGLKLPVVLWSFQMMPFPGYAPGYNGTVGGYTATITEET